MISIRLVVVAIISTRRRPRASLVLVGDLSDDDPTPQHRRPRSHRSDADLDVVAREHCGYPRGVPILAPPVPTAGPPAPPPPPHEPILDTVRLLARDLSQSAIEVVRRSPRNGDDPATFADVVNLAEELLKERRERDSSNQQCTAQLDEILATPREIALRLSAVEKTLKKARHLLITAVVTVGTGLGTIASGLLDRHDASVGDAVRLQQLQKDVDRLDGDVRDLRIQLGRRAGLELTDHGGWLAPTAPTSSKGPVP